MDYDLHDFGAELQKAAALPHLADVEIGERGEIVEKRTSAVAQRKLLDTATPKSSDQIDPQYATKSSTQTAILVRRQLETMNVTKQLQDEIVQVIISRPTLWKTFLKTISDETRTFSTKKATEALKQSAVTLKPAQEKAIPNLFAQKVLYELRKQTVHERTSAAASQVRIIGDRDAAESRLDAQLSSIMSSRDHILVNDPSKGPMVSLQNLVKLRGAFYEMCNKSDRESETPRLLQKRAQVLKQLNTAIEEIVTGKHSSIITETTELSVQDRFDRIAQADALISSIRALSISDLDLTPLQTDVEAAHRKIEADWNDQLDDQSLTELMEFQNGSRGLAYLTTEESRLLDATDRLLKGMAMDRFVDRRSQLHDELQRLTNGPASPATINALKKLDKAFTAIWDQLNGKTVPNASREADQEAVSKAIRDVNENIRRAEKETYEKIRHAKPTLTLEQTTFGKALLGIEERLRTTLDRSARISPKETLQELERIKQALTALINRDEAVFGKKRHLDKQQELSDRIGQEIALRRRKTA